MGTVFIKNAIYFNKRNKKKPILLFTEAEKKKNLLFSFFQLNENIFQDLY